MLIAWQVINKGQSWGVRPNFLNNFCVALRGTLRSRWGPADKKRGPSDPARVGQSLATNAISAGREKIGGLNPELPPARALGKPFPER